LRRNARANELAHIEQRYFRYPGEVEQARGYLNDQVDGARDVYYGVHLFREPGSRLAANAVGSMRCCWLDEDEGHFPESGPEPTAVVYSSENRRHLYWRLARAMSAEWVVSMNRRLAAWASGDSGKAGLASVLRVPETMNFKRYPQIDPVRLEVTGVPPWEPEVLEQATPAPEVGPGRSRHTVTYDGPPVEVSDYLDRVEVIQEVPDSLGVKWAIVCPWTEEHSGGDRTGTYIGQRTGGGPWFFCNHDHCIRAGRFWREFKNKTCPTKLLRGGKSKARRIWRTSS
jgi:hypothetical protein